ASHRDSPHLVQDAYSLRCAPQVHGAFRDTLAHAESVLVTEMGSVSDNPIVFPDEGDVDSGGNFHGMPVALAREGVAAAVGAVAVEALAAAQAMQLRAPLRPARGTAAALATIREGVPFLERDRQLKPDVDDAIELVHSGALVDAVESELGALD